MCLELDLPEASPPTPRQMVPAESTVLLICTTDCLTDMWLACSTSLLFPSGSASGMTDIVWQA